MKLIKLLALLLCSHITMAQHYGHSKYSAATGNKTTVAAAAEDNYDIHYVRLNLQMTNTSTYIAGDAITKAKVTAPSMPAYVFELDTALTIDSVTVNGISLAVSTAGFVRSVNLPTPLAAGAYFTAQVFYHGLPSTAAGYSAGIRNYASTDWGTLTTYTSSESYHSADWWPCKQSLRDKIDSSDVWVTVDTSLKAGSNGLLDVIVPVDATHVQYRWKERYPIDYYLISIAVGPYVEYSYYMHFSGSTDSMLIQNYIYNNPATLPFYKPTLDSIGLCVDYFSTLFGRYPFDKEKYGHSMAEWVAMENQTMTTIADLNIWDVAHELGHQWFGDNVTCDTWADIFLNESIATYCTYLMERYFHGTTAGLLYIGGHQSTALSFPGGTVYVDDTTNESRIFDGRLSYSKGSCILHMLRFIVNDDNVFFSILKNYQSQFRLSTATILDFKDVAKTAAGATVNGVNLDTFFDHWIYREGYPIYNVKWNQEGEDVYLKLIQSTSVPSSVALFGHPFEIKLRSFAGDTVVKVFNDASDQDYHFTWNKSMYGLQMDPNRWMLYKLNGVVHDVTLSVTDDKRATSVRISPNPSANNWTIDGIQENSRVLLTDLSGKVLWQDNSGADKRTIPGTSLASGIYALRIIGNNGVQTRMIIKE
jgi:aminopeptidase N